MLTQTNLLLVSWSQVYFPSLVWGRPHLPIRIVLFCLSNSSPENPLTERKSEKWKKERIIRKRGLGVKEWERYSWEREGFVEVDSCKVDIGSSNRSVHAGQCDKLLNGSIYGYEEREGQKFENLYRCIEKYIWKVVKGQTWIMIKIPY